MQTNHHSWKEHTKMSKIAKFGCEMLYNAENNEYSLAKFANFDTYYTFVLRAEIATTFGQKMVAISTRNCKSIQNLRTLQFYSF
jgi:hypothetical protein